MSHLKFPAMEEVSVRVAAAPHVLLGLDYDGALTPIVDDPSQAVLSSSMRQLLWLLVGRTGVTLAVMSGRSVQDLQERVGISGVIYAGNHGMEIRGAGFEFIEPSAAARAQELKELADDLRHQLRNIGGVLMEDKGLTLSVHYRRVAPIDNEEVWRVVQTLVANAKSSFHLTTGNKVYEIRPHLRWNKGTALTWIGQQLEPKSLMIYLGDDSTDEDAFHAIGEIDGITVRVGESTDTAARYVLPGPKEAQSFLEWVDSLLAEKNRGAAAHSAR
jgi:trehalose 6-phosphate phosphatase